MGRPPLFMGRFVLYLTIPYYTVLTIPYYTVLTIPYYTVNLE